MTGEVAGTDTVEAPWLDYSVRWRTGDARPGRHRARQSGAGGALRGYRPFWQAPDARRIDVRRSIMEPDGTLMVRETESRGSIVVMVAADLSRSMQPRVGASKLTAVAALVQAASRAAHRAGDAFGFVGFDGGIRPEFSAPPVRARGPALDLARRLAGFVPDGRSAAGMTELAARLPEKRCLVLLVSDFLAPLPVVRAALEALARHDVVPVVLHDAAEAALPRFGLLRLRDAETGARRLLLMRPGLRVRMADQAAAWRSGLDALFVLHARPGFHAVGGLDLAALGRHLLDT